MNIIAREKEQRLLDDIYQSGRPEFLAIYGRRRVGKTYLIQQHFQSNDIYFELTGVFRGTLSQQLQNFAAAFSDAFLSGAPISSPKNWLEAFNGLRKKVASLKTQGRIILFFDELPWLSSQKSGFLSALEHFWNRYMAKDERVVVIVCGSAASWMLKNVINNRGGLHGRLTRKMKLLPYDLAQTEEFLHTQNIHLDRKQTIELYMALGGIPKYLSLLERGKSAAQLINDICFQPNGFLLTEFNTIFYSLFKQAERHIAIVRALAAKPSGLDQFELLKAVGLKSGGTSSRILQELLEAGFVIKLPCVDKSKKKNRYKLIDEYSLFYLKWIEPAFANSISKVDKNHWMKMQVTSSWKSWSGFAFENVCLKHIDQIKAALGLAAVSTQQSCWWSTSNGKEEGAQIDLIIDRADGCINLCEIKFYRDEYVLDKFAFESIERKKQVFISKTHTKKAIFLSLISVYGAKQNDYFNMAISSQVAVDDLFAVII